MYYLNFVFIGIVVGSIYALFGLGLTVVYKATRVPNFAQGFIGSSVAFVFYKLWGGSGVRTAVREHSGFYFQIPFLGSHGWAHFSYQPPALPAWAALVASMAVAAGLGLIVARIMRPFSRATTVTLMILSFGILIVGTGLASNIFSAFQTNVHTLIPIDQTTTHFFHGLNFNNNQLMIVAVTLTLAAGVAAFFRYTHLGVAIRAVADDHQVSQLLGINANTVSNVSWVLGSMLAGIAGILITPLVGLDLISLSNLIVLGFVASLIGGFRSLLGTLIGGLALGVVEQLVIASPITRISSLPPLQDIVALLLIVVLLMARPKWIFSGIRVDEESGVGGASVTFGGQAPAEDRLRAWLRKGPALWLILQDWKTARWVLGFGGMAAMLTVPIFTTGYWSTVLATGIIFSLVALSLVMLTGWAGQVSLAQYAFVGIGAYTTAILSGTAHLPFWLVVPLTVLISVPFSLLIGIPSLRLRGFFLALVTLAFAVAVDSDLFLANSVQSHNSIQWITGATTHRPFSYTSEVFYMGVAVAAACFFVAYNLRRSRTARAFLAIRDSEPTAIAFGVNPTSYKLLAFCIGGAVAAAAGSVFAYVYTTMDPLSFLFIFGVTFVGYGILTGIAELFGAVLVGFLFAVLPQITATPINGVNQTIPILTGVLLIFTIYSYPSGMGGFMKRLFRPDDETAQILAAGEFSPAPGATRQPLYGNGHDQSAPEPQPAAAPTAARAVAPASAAVATATLPQRPVSRYDDEGEAAAWSRAAHTQGETAHASSPDDESGQGGPAHGRATAASNTSGETPSGSRTTAPAHGGASRRGRDVSRSRSLTRLRELTPSIWRRPQAREYPVAEELDEDVRVTGVVETGPADEVGLDPAHVTGEIPRFDPSRVTVLDVMEVTLRFGGLVALDDISLRVDEGEIVGLIGPNGAGKTTLFECISGFYRPDRGHVYYRVPEGAHHADPGRILDLLREPPYRRAWLGIGRTFQNCRMFQNVSVFDALRIAQHRWMTTGPVAAGLGTKASATDEEGVAETTAQICQMMGLQPYENKFCAELSYGTLRLVELAAIMALKPKFLLLDEPSSGISQKETEQLLPLLRDVRDATGSTILIIEHDMPLIMGLSDHIYAMAAGAVIASGTPDEIQADPAVIESYLGTSRYGTVVGSNA